MKSPSESQKSSMKNQTIDHIRTQVAQAFHVFNRYGKGQEALADITRAFIEDLCEYKIEDITRAFKKWRKQSDGMPSPSNILKIIDDGDPDVNGRFKNYGDFNSWPAYCKYLHETGKLSENVDHRTGEFRQKVPSRF